MVVNKTDVSETETLFKVLRDCSCKELPFVKRYQGNTITRDVFFIRNKYPKTLIRKGPNL